MRMMGPSHLEPYQTSFYVSVLWVVLICILIISTVLSWVLWIVLVNYQAWGSLSGHPECVASESEVRVAQGTLNLWLVSEVMAVLWNAVPLTLTLKFGYLWVAPQVAHALASVMKNKTAFIMQWESCLLTSVGLVVGEQSRCHLTNSLGIIWGSLLHKSELNSKPYRN